MTPRPLELSCKGNMEELGTLCCKQGSVGHSGGSLEDQNARINVNNVWLSALQSFKGKQVPYQGMG